MAVKVIRGKEENKKNEMTYEKLKKEIKANMKLQYHELNIVKFYDYMVYEESIEEKKE